MTYQSFATDANNLECPWPTCKKQGLCREHVNLIPPDMVEEFDMQRIRRYCAYRYRFAELIQGSGAPPHPSSLRSAEGSSQGPSAPLSDAASRPHGEGSSAPEVKGSRTFTPQGEPPRSSIRTICAWCKSVIAEGDAPEPVSHGCCPDCVGDLEAQIVEAAS